MKQKQIILVTGATGAQGGSVAKSLLKNNQFSVRIFTRNAHSKMAKELQAAGAEIAEGDLENIESLKLAMKDVYGVFGVTNYWEHLDQECYLGKNLIDAVKQSGIRHLVFSSLPNYNKISKGEFQVPQYYIKAVLEDYAKSLKIPATFVHHSFYYENLLDLYPLQKDKQGNLYFGFPQGNTKLAMASVSDLGGIVSTVFNFPMEYFGRTVGIVAEDRTPGEYAQIMSKVLRANIYYKNIPREEFAALDVPFAEEKANMFDVQRLYIFNHQLDLIESHGLNPEMQTFDVWLRTNRDKFSDKIGKRGLSMIEDRYVIY